MTGFLTMTQFALAAKCRLSAVRGQVRDGLIKHERLGKCIVIPKGELKNFKPRPQGRPKGQKTRNIVLRDRIMLAISLGATQGEVARKEGLTKQRISQIVRTTKDATA